MSGTALSKDIIGRKLDRFEFTIERGKIREFCQAIGETNPIYFSLDEAKKAGYEDIPAPPTFPTVVTFWGYPKIWEDMASMGIDLPRILHLKEEYTYHRTIYPGDVWAQPEVFDVKTGKMDMVSFRTIVYSKADNQPILTGEMAIVIRPEGK